MITYLAYFFLWKHASPQGMTMEDLDKAIEADLAQTLSLASVDGDLQ